MSFGVPEAKNPVIDFLRSINQVELEKEVLAKQSWGSSLMDDIMATLMERAEKWQS